MLKVIPMSVTLDVSHSSRGWSNDCAPQNIHEMSRTFETFHELSGRLKLFA